MTLSELLSISVPQEVRSWVSVRGDEAHIAPQVVRDELFLILREGVRNAVTHSGAETIKVEVDITESRVKATVEDDGRGFEPGEEVYRAGGTGLASMKERTALLGGNISLVSVPGEGTRVEIFLPLPRCQR